MRTRWQTNKGSVYNVVYHIIWCPKYRRAILVDGVAERLKTLLYEQASKFGWIIESMEVMPDHVHLFIKANPIDPIARIVAQLKGYTSHVLRAEFIHLKSKLPTLWTRSYYVETIGHISEDAIKRYIEDQKNK
jgi:putative transposase|nr:MAG TPA: transposase [Herelleviridae sp.]